MILRLKLEEVSKTNKVLLNVIEKDYALSYILAGISKQFELANTLVFKGGTALKKIFFGDYRFSEDLDFSGINAPKGNQLEKYLTQALETSTLLLNNYGPFEPITFKRNPAKSPHPGGQEAFIIYVKYPWQSPASPCRIKIEITNDELVLLSSESKPILHNYAEEKIDCMISCYQKEEIIAEKLRALLQTHQKLVTRGWNRPRARDYYDLWRLLSHYRESINQQAFLNIFDKKCSHRGVQFATINDFFTKELVNEAKKSWQNTLGVLVQNLPECDFVLDETKKLIENILNVGSGNDYVTN